VRLEHFFACVAQCHTTTTLCGHQEVVKTLQSATSYNQEPQHERPGSVAECWDQIVEGYLIPNTGEKTKGGITHERMESTKVLGARQMV
jgi:hypothetical protein